MIEHTASQKFWKSVGRRGPGNKQRRPDVTIPELAYWHPGSVYESLLSRANWISKLKISAQAKRLTRLKGPDFLKAVMRMERTVTT